MQPKVVLLEGFAAIKPLSGILYDRLAGCSDQVKRFSLPLMGALPLSQSYRLLEPEIEDWVGDSPVVVAGHSEGGLLGALYGARHKEVVQVFAMASPFGGTAICRLLPIGALRDMRPGSDFLLGLAQELQREMVTSIYLRRDRAILPWNSPYLVGAHNVVMANHNDFPGLYGQLPDEVELVTGRRAHTTIGRSSLVSNLVRQACNDHTILASVSAILPPAM